LTDGERWTAEALFELRRRGYTAKAWRAFLVRSLERSQASRRARPQLARQARQWGIIGAAAWLWTCAVTRSRSTVTPRPALGLGWWLAVWQMLDWHLGMAEGGDGCPRARLSAADAVTMTRFWLVPIVPALARSRSGLPGVIIVAAATDWLDGELARRHGRTRLGRDLDTTADLAFFTTAALTARAAGRIAPLGFRLFAARQVTGVLVSLLAVFARARRPAIRARPWGALPRATGLAISTAGLPRAGGTLLVIGCLIPPRSTAPHLSPA
jgi:phosphatidylglycerophosphate synthase